MRYDTPVDELLASKPRGIILSGGPESVYSDWAPSIDKRVFEAGVPILGICYGAQLMTQALGGSVERTGRGEYGRTTLTRSGSSPLFADWPPGRTSDVWMSHGDAITEAPPGFVATASTPDAPVAAMHDPERRIYGVQFHPEVVHTERGQSLLERFLFDVCAARPTWTHTNIIETSVDAVRAQVGSGHVLCALSGGVDSAVAAALVHKAVGDQLTLRVRGHRADARGRGRAGRRDLPAPVQRGPRAREGGRPLLLGARRHDRSGGEAQGDRRDLHPDLRGGRPRASPATRTAGLLVQGTLYPDIIESGTEDAAVIKSHHNVGGLPEDMAFELVEPLRLLFKDEVRAVGEELGLPEEIVWRQPFPGPGSGGPDHR